MDAVRGVAISAMVVYHFAWFATEAGVMDISIQSLPWHLFQRSIASTFFFLVGVSLALAATPSLRRDRAIRRLVRVALCAGIVTVTSWVLDPARLVVFGILHSILVASILGLPLARRPVPAAVLGVAVLAIDALVSSPSMDPKAVAWLGLGTQPPATFDHQPLVPWLGVVLLGIGGGHVLRNQTALHGPLQAPPLRWLARAGRWSLELYMVHVPVLILIVGALVLADGQL